MTMNRFRRFLICILVFGLLFTYSAPMGSLKAGKNRFEDFVKGLK